MNRTNMAPLPPPTALSVSRKTSDETKYSIVTTAHFRKMAKIDNKEGIKQIFLSPLCILLVCSPLGILSGLLKWGDSLTFWFNFFAMIPLAKILGDATEELAINLKNDMLSGLLNATFGNAVEMIMTVALLRQGQYAVVKSTLLGSILSNMLLVLGMSFLCGGCTKSRPGRNVIVADLGMPLTDSTDSQDQMTRASKEQKFTSMGALVNVAMLLLAAFVCGAVTVFNILHTVKDDDSSQDTGEHSRILVISRLCSFFIIGAYVAYIWFQLVTHKDAMADEEIGEDEDEEEPELSLAASLGLLFVATVIVAISSEFLTGSLEPALENCGMGKSFVGIILLPIVGNACEHVAAIRFAMQDKAGLAVGIAVGSSVQIALLVTPFSVLVGWLMNTTANVNMDLDLGPLNVTVMVLSVIIILAIVLDGRSNWLEGYMLCTAYVIVAILYFYIPDTP